MEWFLAALAVVVLGLAAVASVGRLGGLPPLVDDRVVELDAALPLEAERALGGPDLRAVEFAVVPRGYAMAQVDELLARLADQLDAEAEPDPSVGTQSNERPPDLE